MDPHSAVQFEAFFHVLRRIMAILGLHVNFDAAHIAQASRRQRVWFWFVVINLAGGTLGSWINLLGVDFMRFTFQSPLSAYATSGLVGVLLIRWDKNRISRIFCELNDMFRKYCTKGSQLARVATVFADSQRFIWRFITCFAIWACLFNLIPVYVLVKDYQRTGEVHLQLPYIIKYPFGFDPYAHPSLFPVIFVNENIMGFSVVSMVIVDNLTLGSIVRQLTMHFSILAEDLQALGRGGKAERFDTYQEELRGLI